MYTGHIFETRCAICGGTGVSNIRDAAAEWTGAQLVHNNPEICRINLEKRAKALEEKEAKNVS